MEHRFSYVTLTAVSSDIQASDRKPSLDHQLNVSKEYGDSSGGVFVREYRINGYHRTGYYNLSDAEHDIPPLAELIRDATAGKYQVIIMESYDRLRDIAWALWMRIKPLKIQLRSAQEALPIVDPSRYDPSTDRLTPKALSGSLSDTDYAIGKINRGFAIGTKKRAEEGKYSRRLPQGYKFVGSKKEYRVDLDPVIKALLIDLKNKYLAGWTFPALAELAESVTHTHWRRGTIKDIFLNPFYAGKTFHDRGYTDKKTNGYKLKEEPVELYDGLHEPCWDIETYHLLVSEVKRRGEHLRHKRTYPLSGLVVCGTCNENMHAVPARNQNYQYYTYYRCRWCKRAIREHVVMAEFVRALRSRMKEFQDAPLSKPEPVDNSRAIASLRKQLDKIRTAYETTDSYTAEEYAERKRAIMREIEKLENVERQQEEQVREQRRQRDALLLVRDLLPGIETWMEITPPGEVNVQLSMVVECVTVHPDKTVRVTLR
jgi:hypothetical protein